MRSAEWHPFMKSKRSVSGENTNLLWEALASRQTLHFTHRLFCKIRAVSLFIDSSMRVKLLVGALFSHGISACRRTHVRLQVNALTFFGTLSTAAKQSPRDSKCAAKAAVQIAASRDIKNHAQNQKTNQCIKLMHT